MLRLVFAAVLLALGASASTAQVAWVSFEAEEFSLELLNLDTLEREVRFQCGQDRVEFLFFLIWFRGDEVSKPVWEAFAQHETTGHIDGILEIEFEDITIERKGELRLTPGSSVAGFTSYNEDLLQTADISVSGQKVEVDMKRLLFFNLLRSSELKMRVKSSKTGRLLASREIYPSETMKLGDEVASASEVESVNHNFLSNFSERCGLSEELFEVENFFR